ncbi:hypothetical protein CO178_01670 [candidate division WWE3 bacterium CG_4_9_14_3_um_filter_34_6]|uniref:DUF2079 domain-containing protein n=1 Tax=candidate division WWE3 bacterium CG_4_9_14_3_um_filter_34_6 TaxID=1975079 RepID=A0A2M7X3G6_UNCKA|nr:MAG: hypothetical protein CO178_01670 [candidate division WWE3 bacterium CG_4_9_14_3_um_filter_34_6]
MVMKLYQLCLNIDLLTNMKFLINRINLNLIILILIALITVTYSFVLAQKRYSNFEYGKFDLGNMSQIIWNTSNGRFMEVTDQFGTNMPRWGMSHVDPILVIFAPLYLFFDHPMMIVLIQHILVISAIFPLFWLTKIKTKSLVASYLMVATYILYPAIGFTLAWTGFHGISFVAPLFIWIVYLLESCDFFRNKNPKIAKKIIYYWFLIILMLMGKEEIGSLLAIFSVFIYFKNKKLAIQTFLVSFIWFIIAFFVIIPSYSNLREQSIVNFAEKVSISGVNLESASGDNFFLSRYSYLGSSYKEIVTNAVLHPSKVIKVVFTQDKVEALNNLFGPLGYIVFIIPVWIISLPDLAIVLLSKDEIFDISNHRIAFVISTLFISYVYLLANIQKFKTSGAKKRLFTYVISVFILISTIFFSAKTNNPLYVSGKSFIENKILRFAYAQKESVDSDLKFTLGDTRKADVPRNKLECLKEMAQIIDKVNPDIYTGPDYLGAHAANRRVNALFPSRYWDADLVIADIYETKTIGPLKSSGWTFNKEGLRLLLDSSQYEHIYSCGKVSAFVKGEPTDSSEFISQIPSKTYLLETKRLALNIFPDYIPENIDRNNPEPIVLSFSLARDTFMDKSSFWTFQSVENEEVKYSYVDYLTNGAREGLDRAEVGQFVKESYKLKLSKQIENGEYYLFYGAGDLLNASEIYLGKVKIY